MSRESMRKAYVRDQVRDLMLAQEKYERDQASRLQHATKDAEERGIEKGILKGIQKGKLEGIKEGELQGILKGKLEAQRALAKRLLGIGMPPEQVADLSGLPLHEIRGGLSQSDAG